MENIIKSKVVLPLPEIKTLNDMQKHLSGFEKLQSATAMTTGILSSLASTTSQIADRFSEFQHELKNLSTESMPPKVDDLRKMTENFREVEEQNERFSRTTELFRLQAKRKSEIQSAIVESRDTLAEQVELLGALCASTTATHKAIQEITNYSLERDRLLADQRMSMEKVNAFRFRVTLWISLAVFALTAFATFLQVR